MGVDPIGNVPGAWFSTLATAQLSPVTGVPNLTPLAEHCPGSVPTVRSPGAVIVGSVPSIMFTTWRHIPMHPTESFTSSWSVNEPIGPLSTITESPTELRMVASPDAMLQLYSANPGAL